MIKQYIALAALALPLSAAAQTIDFETTDGYSELGVYDTWEKSPFRTGGLSGNVKVVDNPYTVLDEAMGAGNASAKVLAYQRSRFGSNTFGARITLAEPLAISPTTQYVHVKIYKPKAGRTMLIGLGARTDRPSQSKEVVQFTELSSSTITPGKWQDAVFAVSGAPGINIYSLVVAADLESPHELTEDHVIYIDDIIINSSATPNINYSPYPISVEKTTTLSRTDRYTSSVKLTTPTDGAQTISVNQQTDKLLYQDCLSSEFLAKAGETVTPTIGYSSTWMCGYVYLDRGNDAKFSYELNDDGTPADGSDLMSYSYYNGKNSTGATVTQASSGFGSANAPGSFTIPSDLTPGYYRLRFKVDWDCIDPAGNTNSGNLIASNGGVIVDTRLNVHGDEVTISRGQNSEGTNGEILDADGNALDNKKIPFGKAYTITAKPGDGFKLSKVVIRHGYNLDSDSLVYETPQYKDETIAAYLFQDNQYTIPAKYIDGDVRITPYFSSDSGSSEEGDDYARNFSDDLAVTRTDRALNSFTVTGSTTTTAQTVTIPTLTSNLVYRDLTSSAEVGAVPGEDLTIAINYTGRAMHPYLYIDYSRDGRFTADLGADGAPSISSELVSFSYYNGKNSLGTTVSVQPGDASLVAGTPTFTLPDLPVGVYRARLKIDWNNIDPAGQWSADGNNKINDNGGQVVDFLLNIHNATGKLQIETTNGSVVGANNTGQLDDLTWKEARTFVPQPAADGYEAEKMVIRHGVNLDGDAYDKHGNRQWSEYEVPAESYTMPADSVNGDVRVTVDFVNASSDYQPVFVEEFTGEDGSQPNSAYWSRSGWATPTWKRFTAQTQAGQEMTGYIEDNKLVLLCMANPYDDEVNQNTNEKLSMISGAIETRDKVNFTYGKVEGRLRTAGHSGNFPAFWMMPARSNYGGWPYSGEIDIWEQIDSETKTHHTIHSKWANTTADGSECKGQTNNPAKTANGQASINQWHTLGLEWTEDLLTWYLDGKKVHSYAKSTTQSDLDNGQWPFDKPFYIILNQSVGNGSWAKNPDLTYTYKTEFDWVRVYQKEGGDLTGISTSDAAGLDFYVQPGQVKLVAPQATLVRIVDLQGRVIFDEAVQGNKSVTLPVGVYVLNGNKVLVP